MRKRIIRHFRCWNIWRKYNLNSTLYKFLVLIGFTKSPTMIGILLPEEQEEIRKSFSNGFNSASRIYIDKQLRRGGINEG